MFKMTSHNCVQYIETGLVVAFRRNGYGVAQKTPETLWQFISKDPEPARAMARLMRESGDFYQQYKQNELI